MSNPGTRRNGSSIKIRLTAPLSPGETLIPTPTVTGGFGSYPHVGTFIHFVFNEMPVFPGWLCSATFKSERDVLPWACDLVARLCVDADLSPQRAPEVLDQTASLSSLFHSPRYYSLPSFNSSLKQDGRVANVTVL
ncbi:hypothetical protein P7K49_004046 [Saguinus oedipus]|uniref:UBC core domain-containing protein n=1 Tax=Saguinus oedipus TaxID=9490 RepID=A0ABQ9W6P5_SAGOE|nr:hypothetical protein P7K49_004046 [Saguinus oedipus]